MSVARPMNYPRGEVDAELVDELERALSSTPSAAV